METKFIPDVMKMIKSEFSSDIEWIEEEDISQNKLYKLILTNTGYDISNVRYKFFVSDLSNNLTEELNIQANDDKSFYFKKKWNYVFCYGKEVNDFHILDKQKLFTLNFSATQEIDRIQQEEKSKLAAAETEITTLKDKVTSLETTITDLVARLTALETA